MKHIDMSRVHLNKRCVGVSPSPGKPSLQVIAFADGSRYEAHVVVGADGIKSTVRGIITNRSMDAQIAWSNTTTYRGLVEVQDTKANGVKVDLAAGFWCFMGPGKVIYTFSNSLTRSQNFIAHSYVPSQRR